MKPKARKLAISPEIFRKQQEGRAIVSSGNITKFALSRASMASKEGAKIILNNARTQLKAIKADFTDSERVTADINTLEKKIDDELKRIG